MNRSSPSKGRILLVDDERNVRLNFRVTLETEGYEVAEAADGASALEALKRMAYDMALVDLRMPGMDGIALIKGLRLFDLNTPCVIITAHGDVTHAVEAMKYGAIDFLTKPIKPDDLRRIVAEVLSRHHPVFRLPVANEFETHLTAAKRLLNLHQYEGAKSYLLKALALNERSAAALNLAGVMFELQENYTQAKSYYKKALAEDLEHEGAQANMRRIYELFQFGKSKEPFHLGS